MRMRVVAGVIVALALLLSTGFGGAVYGEKMRDELHKSVNEINKKALKKAIRYSKIELRIDFGARGLKVIEKVPLYSPAGKLIYFYAIFKDKEGKIFFSMVSVPYKYASVICDGAGHIFKNFHYPIYLALSLSLFSAIPVHPVGQCFT